MQNRPITARAGPWIQLALCLALVATAAAETNIWTGSGNWTNADNWSLFHVPVEAEDVVIDGNVTLTNSTAGLAVFVLNPGWTLTFGGWNTVLTAGVVTVYGTITHAANTDTNGLDDWQPDNRVQVSCGSMFIASSGSINANTKGYSGGVSAAKDGRGPGGGRGYGGGGYGGIGGTLSGGYSATYGSETNPADPGSGGSYVNNIPGNGGGAIRIEATGQVVVNGTVTANGGAGTTASGGGSGGGIHIRCATFDGTNGALSANGGNGSHCGGGGGRIAVIYTDPGTQALMPVPSVRFTTTPGGGGPVGDIGTLYFPDNLFLTETIVHSGQWMTPGFTSWAPDSLTVSNGWIRFPAQDFTLAVTNNVTVIGGSMSFTKLEMTASVMNVGGSIVLTNGSLNLYNGETSSPILACSGDLALVPGAVAIYSAATSGPAMSCGGNLTMANGSIASPSVMAVYSGMTNEAGPAYSAQVNVTGDMWLGSNSWVYPYSHPTLAGAVRFGVQTLWVDRNAGFNADSKGYAGATNSSQRCGPGGGYGSGYGGGSYGGYGGNASDLIAPTYGSASAPTDPGSGGGYANTVAGAGGGVIWIEATGAIVVKGTLSANGGDVISGAGGGGSGGGIYIVCATFDGTNGAVNAKGGYSSCNGGGGRIAVIYTNALAQAALGIPSVKFSTAPGNAVAVMGEIGTLYFPGNCFLGEVIPHSGQWMVPGFTNWAPDNLTISNAWVRFPAADFILEVTNDLAVLCGNSPLNRFDLAPALISCGGNLVLTNMTGVTTGAYLHLMASPNSSPTGDGCGPRVTVGGTLAISSKSALYPYCHPTNGCGIGFHLHDLTVAAAGAINADTLGFRGGTNNADNGQGPGGTLSGVTFSGGAGHGGAGGNGNGGSGGSAYGSSNAPAQPGSGSGYSTFSGGKLGWSGGGLIRLAVTNRIVLNGTITANGTGPSQYGGGSSGGGIYISCSEFSGYGKLSARGGNGGPFGGGGGGGGRVAVWRATDTSALSQTNVSGATGANGNGQTGSVVWVTTSATITNLYSTNITLNAADLVANLVATGMAPATIFCYWGTNDGVNDKGAWATNVDLGIRMPGEITNAVAGLPEGTAYYFRFAASNAYAETWATPAGYFSTAGGAIVLDNDGGATDITCTAATLRGQVLVGTPTPDTYICWGDNDAGNTSTGIWDTVVSLGPQLGAFSCGLTGLVANQTYFYCCFATNEYGAGWAPSATNFTAASPTASIADAVVVEGGEGSTIDAIFEVTLSLPSAIDVAIGFTTSNGSAAAGSDYTSTGGVLVISAGLTTGVIRVNVTGDYSDEFPGESFFVLLTNATNVYLVRALADGWIADDDDSAETKIWNGSNVWSSLTNWLPESQGLPSPSDSVIIPGGTHCTLTNGTAIVSLTISNNGTLNFAGWETALTTGVSTIYGTITHAANTDTNGLDDWQPDNRVRICCGDLFVASSGSINANAKGYGGGVSGLTVGRGPGGGYSTGGCGGGYGGAGGGASGAYGQTYGSASNPVDPGSGGGYQINNGGAGGGAIWIEASGAVVISGDVTANGGDAVANSPGSGSGGSILIRCATIAGTNGLIGADGGGDTTIYGSWGGGGGRIAVIYTNAEAQALAPVPGIRFTALPGYQGMGGYGDIGTLYFSDNRFLTDLISHSGQWLVPDLTNWAPNNLVVSNAWFRFGASDFTLTVTNALTVLGGGVPLNRLDVTPALLSCGGNLVLTNLDSVTNGAYLRLYASSNVIPDADGCGPRVVAGGTLSINSNSVLFPYSHPTNGCGIRLKALDLFVSTNGAINADGLGFRGGTNGTDSGKGPGGTLPITAASGSGGGGYGGKGGDGYSVSVGGITYGSSNAPAEPGSGSGFAYGSVVGSAGGGLVRLEVGNQAIVNGAISANGAGNAGSWAGGGAGGGIYFSCYRLEGKGSLQANGAPSLCGGGGGGRIAIRRVNDKTQGALTAYAKGGLGSSNGAPGTVVWILDPWRGTFLIIR